MASGEGCLIFSRMTSHPVPCRPCPRLVTGAQQDGLPFTLVQAWKATPDAAYVPAQVGLAWSPMHLHIHAVLTDRDIVNPETRHNARQFLVGDVFEIFLQVVGQTVYHEFHVTPENAQLNLRFPSFADFRDTPPTEHDRFLMPSQHGELFTSSVAVDRTANQWTVEATIPFAVIGEGRPLGLGSEIAVSFSRYDYTTGVEKPVLSSSSPHSATKFHTIAEWQRVVLA
jgi:hypothetical protein